MPALSVIDLAMFMLESRERPFNIGPLAMLAPPRGFRGNFADKLVARMLERPMGEPWNQKFVAPRLGVPRLDIIEDADPRPQVHRLTLDAPGTQAQLFEKICEIHAAPLDRSKLLWELYVIDGVQGGKVVLYGKVHHGIIDGRSFVQAVTQWFSSDPKDRTVRAMWQGLPPSGSARRTAGHGTGRSNPTAVGAMRDLLKKAAGVGGSTLGLYRMLAAQGRRRLGLGGEALDLPFLDIPDVLSSVASPKRNYAFTTLPLGEVKALGKAADATVNDILLAVLDGALTQHLSAQLQLSNKPLVVDMPVALTGASGGNQIAVLQLAMGRPGSTPRQRLAAIRKETARVKAAVKDNSSETVMLYTTVVHALPTLLERVGLKRPLRVSNLLFSNPFGLAGRCYLMGAEVELALPMSVVAAGQMLNITVVTLADRLQIGLLGIPGAIDHINRLATHIDAAYQELKADLAATEEVPAASTRRASKPRRTTRKAVV